MEGIKIKKIVLTTGEQYNDIVMVSNLSDRSLIHKLWPYCEMASPNHQVYAFLVGFTTSDGKKVVISPLNIVLMELE